MRIQDKRNTRRNKRTRLRRRRRTYGHSVSGVMPILRLRQMDLSASQIVSLAVIGAMAALLVWFFVDTRFFVYTAEVQGNSLVNADEVYQVSGLHTLSTFYVDRAAVAERVTRLIPGVVRAQVECSLPDRVRIQIHEGDVRFVWRTAGASFLVDGEGHVLKTDDGSYGELVAIQDLDGQQLGLGSQVDLQALGAVGRLRALMPDVKVFEFTRPRGISLVDARGWRVYFGDDQDMEAKVATLNALVQKIVREGRQVKVIDVRFVTSPYYE
jgi:cell division septal protein FtsQ